MNKLIGTIFQSGRIEFSESENPWIFQRLRAADKAAPTVALDPSKVPIEFTCSANVDPDDVPWMERTARHLDSADKVYLKPDQGSLRLSKAKHVLSATKELILLASQKDVDDFALKNLNNIKYLFANRLDDFRFTVGTAVTAKQMDEKLSRIELKTIVLSSEGAEPPRLYFNATGSDAPVQIVEWRKTAAGDRASRFAPEDARIEMLVDSQRQPIVLLHEYRSEFKNHAFVFEGEALEAAIRKTTTASA